MTIWLGLVSAAVAHLLQAHGGDYSVQNLWFPWLESGEGSLALGFIQDVPGSVAIAALGLAALMFVYQRGLLQPWSQSLRVGAFVGVLGAVAAAVAQGTPTLMVGLTAAAAGALILTYSENGLRSSVALALPLLCGALLWVTQDVGGAAVLRSWNPASEVHSLGAGTTLLLVVGGLLGLRAYPFPTAWAEKNPADLAREFFSQVFWGTAVVFVGLRMSPWLSPDFVLPLRIVGALLLSITALVGLLSSSVVHQIRAVLSVVLTGGFILALSGARMEGLSATLAGGAAVLALSWAGASRALVLILTLCLIGVVPTPMGLGWIALLDSSSGWTGALVWGAFGVLWGMLVGSIFSALWKTQGSPGAPGSSGTSGSNDKGFSPAPWLLAVLASGFPWVEKSPFQTTYSRHVDPNSDAFTVMLVHHIAVVIGFSIFAFFVKGRPAPTTQSRVWLGLSGMEGPLLRGGGAWSHWDQRIWIQPLAALVQLFWKLLVRCGEILRKLERGSHQAWIQVKQPVLAYSGRAFERIHGGSLRWHLSLALTGGLLLFGLILKEMWK